MPIEFELCQDPQLLKQYYQLRENASDRNSKYRTLTAVKTNATGKEKY